MTIVHAETGEVLSALTFDEAVELTDSIRRSVADIEEKIVRAYFGRAWVAMDYASWDEYVQGEFKQAPLQLPREDRRVQVASLRSQGLSQPAIASVVGVNQATVNRDLMQMHNQPESVTGIDGKEYSPTRPTVPQEVRDTTPIQNESCPYCGQNLPVHLRKEG